jgi:two-component system, OmpR family, sensor kinase
MTLRLRLVLALVLLVAVGLAIFGIATYSLYSSAEYARLDDQVRASVGIVTAQLLNEAGYGAVRPDDGPRGGPPATPPVVVPPGTYAELRDETGAPISSIQLSDTSARPDLPDVLRSEPGRGRLYTTGSATGEGSWRVLVAPTNRPPGDSIVVAVPTSTVQDSLDQLVLIEVFAAAVLLAILAAGSWLVLRRGLRPLENMATEARSITAGDLSHRVSPADDRSEVGELGLALNTMLGELEMSFDERAATEQRLRQFLSDASHELRTPLTSIQGFAELFRLGADRDLETTAVSMRRIEEESARMKILVDDLLLLARLDETRAPERKSVDVTVIAADACRDAVAVDDEHPFTLDAPEPVVVAGDEDHLRQAVANLVTNAQRHTPARTPIEVSTAIDDGSAVIAVRDHGTGLDDEALAHVFDRFWQANPARSGGGAGLGLSIVAAVAEEHGGSAAVENAEGGGARFTIRLPLDGASPSPNGGGGSTA